MWCSAEWQISFLCFKGVVIEGCFLNSCIPLSVGKAELISVELYNEVISFVASFVLISMSERIAISTDS